MGLTCLRKRRVILKRPVTRNLFTCNATFALPRGHVFHVFRTNTRSISNTHIVDAMTM
jgi:hypothetical protein